MSPEESKQGERASYPKNEWVKEVATQSPVNSVDAQGVACALAARYYVDQWLGITT